MIHLDLLVIIGGVAKPLVRHFSDDWRWLPLVTTADDLDAATLEPVKEDLQRGAVYRAYLVPDDHPGNEPPTYFRASILSGHSSGSCDMSEPGRLGSAFLPPVDGSE